ncbi:MAG: hypothetical protein V1852_00585 [Pseudomonadota bacterium]
MHLYGYFYVNEKTELGLFDREVSQTDPRLSILTFGLDHRTGHARIFFPERQELAIAQTACRSSKNTLARPACRGKLAETMIKA